MIKKIISLFSILVFCFLLSTIFIKQAKAQALSCGASTTNAAASCSCTTDSGIASGLNQYTGIDANNNSVTSYCCGWVRNNVCLPTVPIDEGVNGVTDEFFNALNPLKIAGGASIKDTAASAQASKLSTPGGVISRTLDFAFPVAGVILFVMITWGGFEMILGASEKKSLDAGRQRITAAIVGFLLLFSTYWLTQIVSYVFGVVIL